MTNEDLVRRLVAALDAWDEPTIRDLVAEDFRTVPHMTGDPMDRDAWLASHAQVHAAFPTLRRNPSGFQADGDEVDVTFHITVMNDRVVELPALGIERLEPTGRLLTVPPHMDTFSLRDGLVSSVRSDIPPGGGLQGILDQIREGNSA